MTYTLAPKSGRPSRRNVRLVLKIQDTFYKIQALAADFSAAERAFRLLKADGQIYDVTQTSFGPTCDCPDFIFRRDGLDPDGCKHIQALQECGLIGL